MKAIMKRLMLIGIIVSVSLSLLSGCSTSKAGKSNAVTLTYDIWDSNQKPGMEAIVSQFEKENPNIKVNVEVTPWAQYWTKLTAAATGGSLPDVFWMHPDNIVQFAEGGMLMDITNRVAKSKSVLMSNFVESVVKTSTVNNKLYAMPKDYGTLGLWYNKALFDAKGIPYPNSTWTWATLEENAKKLTDPSKGIYGFLSPANGQNSYWNFVWQNGGYIISNDKKKSGFDLQKTKDAIQYGVNFVKDGISPTPAQFANTNENQYFESGKAAMGTFGSWMITEFDTNSYVKANCNVVVLPQGVQKASLCSGMSNSISAKTKHPEEAWKFLEYLGTKEANDIQGKSGAAIPAYKGSEQSWTSYCKDFNLKAFTDESSYGFPAPTSKSQPTWSQYENDIITKVYAGQISVNDGCNEIAKKTNQSLASETN